MHRVNHTMSPFVLWASKCGIGLVTNECEGILMILRSNDPHCERLWRALSSSNERGEITSEQLSRVVKVTVKEPRRLNRSFGMNWIQSNLQSFPAIVGDPEAFFRQHFGVEGVADVVIADSRLLHLIDEDRRADFVRDAYLTYGGREGWVAAVIEAGVHPEVIAELILARLRVQPADAHSFLKSGAGFCQNVGSFARPQWTFARNTPWGVLGERFDEALAICTRIAPGRLFMADRDQPNLEERLLIRMTKQELDALLSEAARHLESVEDLSTMQLARLPLVELLALARRLHGGSLVFMTYVASQLPHGKEVFDELFLAFEGPSGKHLSDEFQRDYSGISHLQYLAGVEQATVDYAVSRMVEALRKLGFVVGQLIPVREKVTGRALGVYDVQSEMLYVDQYHSSLPRWQRVDYWVMFSLKGSEPYYGRVSPETLTNVRMVEFMQL